MDGTPTGGTRTFSVILERLVLFLELPQQPRIYLHRWRHGVSGACASLHWRELSRILGKMCSACH